MLRFFGTLPAVRGSAPAHPPPPSLSHTHTHTHTVSGCMDVVSMRVIRALHTWCLWEHLSFPSHSRACLCQVGRWEREPNDHPSDADHPRATRATHALPNPLARSHMSKDPHGVVPRQPPPPRHQACARYAAPVMLLFGYLLKLLADAGARPAASPPGPHPWTQAPHTCTKRPTGRSPAHAHAHPGPGPPPPTPFR